jgi:hypothetical protein
MTKPDTSREAVERLAHFHALSSERYDADEESGLKACATMTAAMLRTLLAEREAAMRAVERRDNELRDIQDATDALAKRVLGEAVLPSGQAVPPAAMLRALLAQREAAEDVLRVSVLERDACNLVGLAHAASFRAGAEAMRADIAEREDCGDQCAADTPRGCHETPCGRARALYTRALPLPEPQEPPHDRP